MRKGTKAKKNSVVKKNVKTKKVIENLQNNDTLLISEIQNKVILPYSIDEVKEIFSTNKDKYKNEKDVINDLFIRDLSDYQDPFESRFREAYNLVTKRDKYSKIDGIRLGLELFGKKYLHPAIISACRNTDELDVYLDCLEKDELNDFQIFKIKYEIYPLAVKNDNQFDYFKKISEFLKNLFLKKGKHDLC